MLSLEDKKDVARRLYDEGITPGHECGQECFMDGLWFGLMCAGMEMEQFAELQHEVYMLLDGLVEGEWS